MAQLKLEHVDKVYEGDVKVVDDFNLDIDDGEFIVLVGPSGCGKSTTLRMIAGLEDITAGKVQIGDRVVNDVPPKDRDIAMVFQSYALYPHMTVWKNMAFALELRRTPKPEVEKRVARAADILGIGALLERKPKALSGGQRQRVALGRAIVRNPQCFLFDEPLSNLDAALRVEMRAEIKQLHMKLGATTVYVTHDQEEAMTLGDRVVVMNEGVVQQVGSASEIYHQPRNRFVAGFLGSPAMNFFEGTLLEADAGLCFDEGTRKLPLSGRVGQTLKAHANERVMLGVRPELMSDEASARFQLGQNFLTMKAELVQPLGDRMNVYLSTEAHPKCVAQVPTAASFRAGETLPVYIDMERVHFFKIGASGESLAHGNAPRS